MNKTVCPLCGKKSEGNYIIIRELDESGYRKINCSKCGTYKLNKDVEFTYSYASHYKFSCWIREQNDNFKKHPEIDKVKLEEISHIRDKKIQEKFDLMMQYLSKYSKFHSFILSKCWIKNRKELSRLFTKALEKEFVKGSVDENRDFSLPIFKYLTFDGLEYIETLEEPNKNAKNIFVAFNFTKELIPIFSNQVKEAVEETGFTYTIVNQETTPHDQKITDEIVAKIKSSRMIIADFTNSSTNVYFEAGYAMGMKIPVIWTCKAGHTFSFDTGQFPHITWKDADDLKKQLVNRIQAIM